MLPVDRAGVVDLVEMPTERLCIEAIEVWALSAAGPDGCAWIGPGGEFRPVR